MATGFLDCMSAFFRPVGVASGPLDGMLVSMVDRLDSPELVAWLVIRLGSLESWMTRLHGLMLF